MRPFIICTTFFVLLSRFSSLNASQISSIEACTAIKKEKQHVAYLLNSDGTISKGPIDYGKWTDDGKSDEVLLPTRYKLLIYPARTEIIDNDCFQYGCLKLVKTNQMCKDVATYNVQVRLIFRRKIRKFYQYVDNIEFVPLEIDDSEEDNPTELIYRFSPRITGIVCKPSKKD